MTQTGSSVFRADLGSRSPIVVCTVVALQSLMGKFESVALHAQSEQRDCNLRAFGERMQNAWLNPAPDVKHDRHAGL